MVQVRLRRQLQRRCARADQPIYVEKSLIGSPSGTTLSQQDLQVLMDMPASGKRILGELFAFRYRLGQISEAYDAPQGGAGIDC